MCVRACAVSDGKFFSLKKKGKHSELKADYSLHLAVIISAAFLSPAFSGWKLQMGPPTTYLNSSTEVPVLS